MAELFTVRFEVDSNAPVETVTRLFSSIAAVSQAAFELAGLAAQQVVGDVIAASHRQGVNGASIHVPPTQGGPSGRELSESEVAAREQLLRGLAERAGAVRNRTAHELAELDRTIQEAAFRRMAEEEERVGLDAIEATKQVQRELRERADREPISREEIGRLPEDARRRLDDISERAQETLARIRHRVQEEAEQERAERQRQVQLRAELEMADLARQLAEALSVDLVLPPALAWRVLPDLIALAMSPPPTNNEMIGRYLSGIAGQVITELTPTQQYRFRSARYGSPLVVEIISGAGLAAWAFERLLRVIRDWRSDQRRSLAAAADAESQALFRMELRQLVSRQAATGELRLTPEMVDALISRQMTDAIQNEGYSGRAVEVQADDC